MKKVGILLLILLLFNILIFVNAQSSDYGTVDENTGLPKEFSKFSEAGQKLSEEEQRKEYMKQEWTILAADNKIIGPILFYTNKFFAFFNPFWKLIFGVEFGWSWVFIFSFLIWILLIVLILSPVRSMTETNIFLSIGISAIVATLASLTGLIKQVILFLTAAVKSFWIAVGITAVIVAIMLLYSGFMKSWGKQMKEEAEKEELDRAKQNLKAAGDAAEKQLKGFEESK